MRVAIKEDMTIPPGYTLVRCDTYTHEELMQACAPSIRRTADGRERINLNALEYVAAHPKMVYTSEDVGRIRDMRPVRIGCADRKPKREAKKSVRKHYKPSMQQMPVDLRSDVPNGNDMTMAEAARYFRCSHAALKSMVTKGGMPHRQQKEGRMRRFLRRSELLEWLEGLSYLTTKQREMKKRLLEDR